MSAFEDITLSFQGAEYTVTGDRVWELLMQLENVMGYDYLIQRLAVNDVPAMHVYRAFAIALRFAGHKTAKPEDIQQGVNRAKLYDMALSLAGILRLTMPPDDMETMSGEQPSQQDVEDVKKKD